MAKIINIFRVTKNYGTPIDVLVEAGRYSRIPRVRLEKPRTSVDRFLNEHFPLKTHNIEIQLVHMGRKVSTKGVLDKLAQSGLRGATIRELLALGAAFPELQRRFWIAAVGRQINRPSSFGLAVFPVLGECDQGRCLDLVWDTPIHRWDPEFRFAAVAND